MVCDTIPAGLDRPALPEDLDSIDADLVEPGWRPHASSSALPRRQNAFASWTAYQSRGIRTQVAGTGRHGVGAACGVRPSVCHPDEYSIATRLSKPCA